MIDPVSIQAFGDEYRQIIKQATTTAISKLTKGIRPTPLPRVNLPVPKVGV